MIGLLMVALDFSCGFAVAEPAVVNVPATSAPQNGAEAHPSPVPSTDPFADSTSELQLNIPSAATTPAASPSVPSVPTTTEKFQPAPGESELDSDDGKTVDSKAGEKTESHEKWGLHYQATTVTQGDSDNNVPPYEQPGANGFNGNAQTRTSFTTTLFLGAHLLKDFEVYVDPEISAGSGLSDTHGIAGYPNGEIYRVDSPDAKLNLARAYFRYTWNQGGEREVVDSAQNQVAMGRDENRLSVVAGKFSLNDFFDENRYSHDPRTQFLNWSLMDNGAWDYAADTRGYTWGFMVEWNRKSYAIRFASVLEPKQANQLDLDTNIAQSHGDNLELEYRYAVAERPGIARLLGYINHADMGSYQDALDRVGFKTVDVTASRAHRIKYGIGLNLEQELTDDWGVFGRLGWNDGATESWAFTEVDLTGSAGIVWKPFEEREDRWGFALVINGLSPLHRRYLEAGGQGFIIGEGGMNYGPEEVVETYYSLAICQQFAVTADYQLVTNAAYNQDRSGVSIFALRLHTEL